MPKGSAKSAAQIRITSSERGSKTGHDHPLEVSAGYSRESAVGEAHR